MTSVWCLAVPYPGVVQWLKHGAEVGLWDFSVLQEGQVTLPKPGVEWLVLGAWHPVYEQAIEWAQREGVKVAVAWSSSATEMDNARVEIEAVLRLRERKEIRAWLCLNPDLVPFFGSKGRYLPGAVSLPGRLDAPLMDRSGVGFYAPSTPKKNGWSQVLGVAQVQQGGRPALHTNTDIAELAQRAGVEVVVEGWVDRGAHLSRLGKREAVLCASHAESLCYGAVDGMAMDTPTVGSPTIAWLPESWRVLNPNSPREIAAVLRRVLEAPRGVARAWVEGFAAAQNEAARMAVDGFLAT